MEVRVRMAPSPTGNLHLGTAYATLWPYIFAKKMGGKFILRIEDTDNSRSTKEFEQNIIDGLKWLGFNWDEGPYHQMDQLDLYGGESDKLLSQDKAYYCFCTKEELDAEKADQVAQKLPLVYSGKCRDLTKDQIRQRLEAGDEYVVRFKLSQDRGVVEFNDLIHGLIKVDTKTIGDFVIMRASGIPLYNFAVVVDDIQMRISHVLRGDDHISNTPKQILLFEAFGQNPPEYAHYPMILNQDRIGKLSKRTSSTSVDDYRKAGYLPQALVNYLALLGYSIGDQEKFTLSELISDFEIKKMSRSAAAWNEEKLDWLNGEYIRQMSNQELTHVLTDYLVDHPSDQMLDKIVPIIKERIKKLSDFVPLCDFFFAPPEYERALFESLKIEKLNDVATEVFKTFEKLNWPLETNEFESKFVDLARDLKLSNSQIFQLLRVMISGKLVSPPLYESILILGERECKDRLKMAIDYLNL